MNKNDTKVQVKRLQNIVDMINNARSQLGIWTPYKLDIAQLRLLHEGRVLSPLMPDLNALETWLIFWSDGVDYLAFELGA